MKPDFRVLFTGPPRWTVAAAESLTGGRVQARFTAVSGSSAWFLGGVTAYTVDLKVRLLGVEAAAARPVEGVSAEVARQMAAGACRLFRSDFAVATTGYAEPDPARAVAVPHAHWALCRWTADGPEFRHGRVEMPGLARTAAQERVVDVALEALAAWLEECRRGRG